MMLARNKAPRATVADGESPPLCRDSTYPGGLGNDRKAPKGRNNCGCRFALFNGGGSHNPNNTYFAFLVKLNMRSSYFGEILA